MKPTEPAELSESVNSGETLGLHQNKWVGSRTLLYLALLLAVSWWVVLGGLTLFTANPITFNRQQILHADLVVVATVSKRDQQGIIELNVEEELLRNKRLSTIFVKEPHALTIELGKKYLVPISIITEETFN